MNFKRTQIKEFMESKGILIDVRSPSEYYKGNMPNSINIPLFNNEERSIVGKSYKNEGKEISLLKGLEIVEKKLDDIITQFLNIDKEYLKKYPNNLRNKFKIYCARGGMRSQSIFWLLNKLNFHTLLLTGGYKNYRRTVLNKFNDDFKLIIIGGKTGSGKTNILNLLKKNNYQIIDLEFLANHRGSTFGALGMNEQPTNEQFENSIANELFNFDIKKEIFIEAESSNIGKCRIPNDLFKKMKLSNRIEIIRSERERINELVRTYSVFPKNELIESVNRIKKRLGPQRTQLAIKSVEDENWQNVCKAVLDYYDKCYEYELKGKNNVKILDLTDIDEREIIPFIIKSTLKN